MALTVSKWRSFQTIKERYVLNILLFFKTNYIKLKLLKNYTVLIVLVFKYMPTLNAGCWSSDAMNDRATSVVQKVRKEVLGQS